MKNKIFLCIVLLLGSAKAMYSQEDIEESLIEPVFEKGMEAFRDNKYEDALHPFMEGLKILESSDSKWYNLFSGMAVLCYRKLGNFSKALELQGVVVKRMENLYGKDSYQYAQELVGLGTVYRDMGNPYKAIELGKHCLDIYFSKGDSVSNECGEASLKISSAYMDIDNYLEAFRHCSTAMKIAKAQKNSTMYIVGLNNMSVIFEKTGNYDDAIFCGEECLKILTEKKEENTAGYAKILSNVGLNYVYSGQIIKGRSYIEEALMIMKNVYGEKHPNYATLLANMGYAYSKYGDYNKAIISEKKALAIYNDLPIEKNHHSVLTSLSNLVSYCYHEGNLSAAKLYEKEYQERVIGDSTVTYATFLHNIASYDKNHQNAIANEYEALNIAIKQNAMLLVANIWDGIAYHYYEEGKYEEALTISLIARQTFVNIVGDKHHDYYYSLHILSSIYWKLKEYRKAADCYKELITKVSNHILGFFPSLSIYQQKDYWALYNKMYEENLHKYAFGNMDNPEYIQLAYNGILLSKALLLNSEIEMKQLLYEHGDKSAISIFDEIKVGRSIINKLNSLPISKRNINLDSLNLCVEAKEKLLIDKSKIYGNYTKNLRISWKDVQQKLGVKDLSIEFVSFPLNNDSLMYVAYVLRKDMNCPKFVPLFEEKQLKKGNKSFINSSVSELVWKPLAKYFVGIDNVYFAPSGELYNIAIESLPHWSEKCLISDKWNMYRLSSTRQLALIKSQDLIKRASVYGGIKYETNEDLLIADSKKYSNRDRSMEYETYRIANSLNLRSGVAYLPATKIEAEEIEKTLKQKKIATSLKIDTLATEGTFKDLSGKKTNLLHIATHGFYWTEEEAKRGSHLNFLIQGDRQQKFVEDKALTRSGLMLVGANNVLMGKKLPEGVDDGILTAKEISLLDLRGLDLVVLSACQTGLGEISGDGVFGLQRGFKKAGAQSLLMSLWKVDDTATQLLMTQFYKNLTSGMSKYESLKQAQKYVREYEVEVEVKSDSRPSVSAHAKEQAQQNATKEIKKVKKYKDPYYWAAFILLDAFDFN